MNKKKNTQKKNEINRGKNCASHMKYYPCKFCLVYTRYSYMFENC